MAMAASYVWDRNTPNAFPLREKRYFAATIVSTVIDYLDAIHANNGNVAAMPFPHARWNNWFTARNNLANDYGKDPLQFSNNPTIQAATFGLTMDAARSTRGSVAHFGCEVAAGVPLLQLHGTKMHFQPWTYQPAAECSTFVGKEDTGQSPVPRLMHQAHARAGERGKDHARFQIHRGPAARDRTGKPAALSVLRLPGALALGNCRGYGRQFVLANERQDGRGCRLHDVRRVEEKVKVLARRNNRHCTHSSLAFNEPDDRRCRDQPVKEAQSDQLAAFGVRNVVYPLASRNPCPQLDPESSASRLAALDILYYLELLSNRPS
ncbi:hypothetical protein BDZ88DRAFT_442902 [Geranomyces variabilis]|nr:hypothetical protein BDZ88DRAFT_442902 [Geranomyces variabilis]